MGEARGKSRTASRGEAKREEGAAVEGRLAAMPTLTGPLRSRGGRMEYDGVRWMGETIRKGDVVLLQAPKGELSYVALISALFQPSADPDAEPQALCRWFYRFEDMPASARSAVNFSRNKRLLALHLWLTDCEDANPVSSILDVVGCKPIVDMHDKAIGKTLERDNHLGFWCAQQFDVRTRRTSTLTNAVFLELRTAWLRSQPEVHRTLTPDASDEGEEDQSASDRADAPAPRPRKRLRSSARSQPAASEGSALSSRPRRSSKAWNKSCALDGSGSDDDDDDDDLPKGPHGGGSASEHQGPHPGVGGAGAGWPTQGSAPFWVSGLPPTHLLPPPPPGVSPVVSIPASRANLGSPPLATRGQHFFLPPGFFPTLVPSLPLAQAQGFASPAPPLAPANASMAAAAAGAALGAGWRQTSGALPVRVKSSSERARTQVARPHIGSSAAQLSPSASERKATRAGRASRRHSSSGRSSSAAARGGNPGSSDYEEAAQLEAGSGSTRGRAKPQQKRARTASAAVSAVVTAATDGTQMQGKGKGGASSRRMVAMTSGGGKASARPFKQEPESGPSSGRSGESDESESGSEDSSSSRPLRFCSRVGAEFQAAHLPPVRPKPPAEQTQEQEPQEQGSERQQHQGGGTSCLWRAGTASRETVSRYLSRLRAMAVGWRGTNVLHTDLRSGWEGQRAVVCTNDAEDEAEVSSDIVVRPWGSAQPQRVDCSCLHACIRVDLALRLLYEAGGDVKAALPRVAEHRLLLQRREDTMSTTAKAWTRAERERLLRSVAYWADGRVRWQRTKFHQAARMLKRRPGDVMAWYYANKKVPLTPQEQAEAERAGAAAEKRLTRREATFMAARAKKQQTEPRADTWSCPRCTFANTQARRLCALCHTPRWARRTASSPASRPAAGTKGPRATPNPAAGLEATLDRLHREGSEELGARLRATLLPLLEPTGAPPDEVAVRRILLDVADTCCAVPRGDVVLYRVAKALG